MKNLTKWFVMCVVCMLVLVGCAKEPTKEIDEAKAAIEAVVQDGGDIYTPAEIQALNNDLAAVTEEAKAKTGKLFKSNKEAMEKLLKIKTDAEALKAAIPAKIEEAKNNALTAQTEAQTALDEAINLVAKAPRGKGTQADIAAFKTDLTALQASLPEIQTAIDGADFLGAAEKAKTIIEKATAISDQIKLAIEKVKK